MSFFSWLRGLFDGPTIEQIKQNFNISETEQLTPNELLPNETLAQFHRRIYDGYSSERKAPAVAMLRRELPASTRQEIRDAIAADPDNWAIPYHFWWGMGVRNLLRREGFDEAYWPIWNLDDLYVMLVEDAVRE